MQEIVSSSRSNKVDNPFAQITRSDLIALAGLISVTRGKGKPQRDRYKPQLKAIDVIVWAWISTYTRPDRPWTVSQVKIAHALGRDRRTIARSVDRLRRAQVLQTKPDPTRSGATLWTIAPSHLWQGQIEHAPIGWASSMSQPGETSSMSQPGGHAACPSGVGMQHVSHTDNPHIQIANITLTHKQARLRAQAPRSAAPAEIDRESVCVYGFATQEAKAAAATEYPLTVCMLVDGGMRERAATKVVRTFASACPDDRVLRKAIDETITWRMGFDEPDPTDDPIGHIDFDKRDMMSIDQRRARFRPDHRALDVEDRPDLCGLVVHRLTQSPEHRAALIDKYREIDAKHQRWIAAGRPSRAEIEQAQREQAERARDLREQDLREQAARAKAEHDAMIAAQREQAARDQARREQAQRDAEREAAAKREREQTLQAALDALSDGQRADLERERDAMIEAEADRALAAIPAGWSAEQTASVRRITERQRAIAIDKARALVGLDCPHRRRIIERRIDKAVAVA